MEFATFDDRTIAFKRDGVNDGPTVVLTHGLGMNMEMWDDVIPLLPSHLHILRYDLRGHGASSAPNGPYSMGALVRDAERLLDHLYLRDTLFVGYGLGGLVAQGLAVKRLDQIRALVLSHTAAKMGYGPKWHTQIDLVRKNGLGAIAADHIKQATGSRCPADIRELWQGVFETTVTEGYCGCASAIAGADFYTPTSGLRLPTLAIAGTNDRIVPADMVRETADLIPGTEVKLLREGGHYGPIEASDSYAASLCNFIRAIGH